MCTAAAGMDILQINLWMFHIKRIIGEGWGEVKSSLSYFVNLGVVLYSGEILPYF